MAQNEMRAMRGMPQCVRLNEGLGRTPTNHARGKDTRDEDFTS